MGAMIDPARALAAIGELPDDEIDLAGAAIQLARADDPRADPTAALAHLSALAREAAALEDGKTAASRAAALARLLGGQHGYRGDDETYDDLANADLIQVIARRRGLPVALGIVWLHAAQAAGWRAWGLDAPGHFLLALDGQRGPLVIDAFDRGRVLRGPDLRRRLADLPARTTVRALAPMPPRAILLRLQNNIRSRRELAGDLDGALDVLDRMLLIAPDELALWQDAAAINLRLGRIATALRCLQQMLGLTPEDGPTAASIRAQMDELRARLA
jgi:regulator of sirC expression with transglutaminase-like and TPR domain